VPKVYQPDKNLIVPLIYKPWGELMTREAEKLGLRVMRQFFVDRMIESNGMLVNRNKPGPVITDWKQYSDRALKMTGEGKVIAFSGKEI